MFKVPEIIVSTSRKLRKNMTKSETKLWDKIRWNKLWVKVLRQKPIYVYTQNSWLDRFIIADFYLHSQKIIIEIDGKIHEEIEVLELDKHKEILLKNLWYEVIRFTNNQIENDIDFVVSKIKLFLP